MRTLTLLMHASLDGFVGGLQGEMDWIKIDDELFGFVGKIVDQADAGLYGRVTYQMMESYWPTAGDKPNASKHDIEHSQWYQRVEKIVISNSMKESNIPDVQIISGNIQAAVGKLKQKAGKKILMIGSPSASHALMQHNLIDEYWIFVNPVLLGAGIPMFKNIMANVNLRLVASKVFSSNVIGLYYEKS